MSTIKGNEVNTEVAYYSYGLHFYYSENNIIINNSFSGSGVYLEDKALSLNNLIAENNTVNGKTFGFFKDDSIILINQVNKYGQLIFYNCESIDILFQNFYGTSTGITVYNSQYLLIGDCTFENNNYGVLIKESNNLTFFHNRFAYNHVGLYYQSSQLNTAYLNTFLFNDYHFWDENPPAENFFYNEHIAGRKGNYWYNNDSYGVDPFSAPTDPILSPEYLTVEFFENDTGNSILWKLISDDNPRNYYLYKNKELIGSGNPYEGQEWNISIDALSAGTYNYSLVIVDWDGFTATANAVVTVKRVPIIMSSPVDVIIEFGESELLQWLATDDNPATYQILINGSEFTSGIWSSNTVINYTIVANSLAPGIYNVTIIVNDANGLQASDSVMVTIKSDETTTITSTTSNELSSSESTQFETEESSSNGSPLISPSPGFSFLSFLYLVILMTYEKNKKRK